MDNTEPMIMPKKLNLESLSIPVDTHARDIGCVAANIGSWCGMSTGQRDMLRTVAYMHRYAYRFVNAAIKDKEGELTESERKALMDEVLSCCGVLAGALEDDDVLEGIMDQYERWDGTGYPKGLKADDVSIYSRIVRIASAYVAMSSGRSYRDPLTDIEIIQKLQEEEASTYDPVILKIVVSLLELSPGLLTEAIDGEPPVKHSE